MSRQINLYNPIFLKQKKYFSAVTMAQGLALILIGMALLVAYAQLQLSIRTRQAADSATQLLKTKGQLISISAKFAPQQSNPALDKEIKDTEAEIQSVEQVFGSLKSGEFGDTKGYSGYFSAFAREIVDGLWLTGVTIYGAGHDINLSGRTRNPQLVPVYLTKLKRETNMQGKSFEALDMKRPLLEPSSESDAKPDVKPDAKSAKTPELAPYVEFNLQSTVDSDSGSAAGVKDK